ncbi:MAG: acyltransferase family protein [Janthinobacterium lividum]
MLNSDLKTPKPRLLSLDVFRGITVAMMTLVNNPGDWGHIYTPLEHSEWNGCTPTDLVFPFFLFIVGVSIVFALESKKADAALHRQLITNIIRRAVILFAIGLILSLFPHFNFATVRIPGVIQRIAVVYLIVGLLYLFQTRKAMLITFWVILIGYYLLMTFVPVPGVGYANLNPETNLGAWIDRSILGEAHLWKSSKTWDPEGILTDLPAVATGIFGVLIGTFLKRKQDEAQKVSWLFAVGVLAVITGLLVDLFFPINKALWTSSYVLYAGGLAVIGLTLLYWLIDVQGYKRFTKPFVIFGVNAITVYTFSGIIPRVLTMITFHNAEGNLQTLQEYLYNTFFVPYFSPINASLAGGLTYVLIWYVILWLMYRKNIIIKV